jgi:hypothetical protein
VPRCIRRLWIASWNIYCEIISKNIYTNTFRNSRYDKLVTFENRTDVLSHFWLEITSVISLEMKVLITESLGVQVHVHNRSIANSYNLVLQIKPATALPHCLPPDDERAEPATCMRLCFIIVCNCNKTVCIIWFEG